jgi:AcrR family transcriptional regulator
MDDEERLAMQLRSNGNKTPAALRTMARFLQAAEDIFGRHGYEGTTVREIAARSDVNLGTLKHYWGSKRELFRDLIERRLRPVHTKTAVRLAAIDPRSTGGKVPDPGAIVACLIEPAFLVGVQSPPDADFNDPAARGRFHVFFGRCLMDPSPEIVQDLNEMFADVTGRFFELMRLASPKLTQAELDWRINCVFGTVSFAQLYGERIGRFVGTEADVGGELASKWVMHFITQGVAAPPLHEAGKPSASRLAVAEPRSQRKATANKRKPK